MVFCFPIKPAENHQFCHCTLQEFEDLDEITARYIQPMASFARDLLGHKYFQECNGGNKEVYAHLHPMVVCSLLNFPSVGNITQQLILFNNLFLRQVAPLMPPFVLFSL